jgi:hypothetical protein
LQHLAAIKIREPLTTGKNPSFTETIIIPTRTNKIDYPTDSRYDVHVYDRKNEFLIKVKNTANIKEEYEIKV